MIEYGKSGFPICKPIQLSEDNIKVQRNFMKNMLCVNNDNEFINSLIKLYLQLSDENEYLKELILWVQNNRDFCVCSAHETIEGIMIYSKDMCENPCSYLEDENGDETKIEFDTENKYSTVGSKCSICAGVEGATVGFSGKNRFDELQEMLKIPSENIISLDELRKAFFDGLNYKTNWGKEQVKSLFDGTVLGVSEIKVKIE